MEGGRGDNLEPVIIQSYDYSERSPTDCHGNRDPIYAASDVFMPERFCVRRFPR